MSTWYLPVTAYTLLKLTQTHSQVLRYQQWTASFEVLHHYQLVQQINNNDITTSSISISAIILMIKEEINEAEEMITECENKIILKKKKEKKKNEDINETKTPNPLTYPSRKIPLGKDITLA